MPILCGLSLLLRVIFKTYNRCSGRSHMVNALCKSNFIITIPESLN